MNTKDEDFLEELTKLTKKHKIFIGGCGCCGSPYLVDFNSVAGEKIFDVDVDIDKNHYTLGSDREYLTFERIQDEEH